LSLIPFYLLLEKKTVVFISFSFTVLMSFSYWFLSFSRNGWFNVDIIFFGLMMYLFLEKGLAEKKAFWFIIAGFFGALCLYGYFSGKVFFLAATLYLVTQIRYSENRLMMIRSLSVFVITIFFIFLPQLVSILKNPANYFLRSRSVLVTQAPKPYEGHTNNREIIVYQTRDTIRGLVLLGGSVIGKGVENQRYTPPGRPVVDPLIKYLFLLGVIMSLFMRWKNSFWWLLFGLTLLLVVIPTVDAPNTARAISVLPVVYFIAALAANEVLKLVPLNLKYLSATALAIIVLCVAIYNAKLYFFWSASKALADARQPAIEYEEFFDWQNYQIERIKEGKLPITNYDWYEIRKTELPSGSSNNL